MKNYTGYFFKRHKGKYILSIIFSVLSAASAVAPYLMTARIIGLLLDGERTLSVYAPYIIAAGVTLFTANLFHKISTGLSHYATFGLLSDIRKMIADKLSRVPLGVIEKHSSGKLRDVMVDKVEAIETTYAHVIPEVTGSVLVSLLILIYLFILNWKLALLALVMLPVALFGYALGIRNMRSRFDNYLEKNNNLNTTIVDYINGIKVIKTFNQSGKEYKKLSVAVKEAAASATEWMRENLAGFAVAFVLIPSTVLVVLPVGAKMYMNGSIDVKTLVTILLLNFAAMGPLLQAAGHMDNISLAGTIMKTVAEILEEPDLIRPAEASEQPKDTGIEFKNVSFAYRADEPVLENLSLHIRPGSVNALVGPSGSGKSTVTKLLSSFYEIDAGEILIGGVNIKSLPLRELNRMIAYVSQKDYLFNTTVMANLQMGDLNKSEAEIIEICKQCGVHDFIMSLENGYETVVGSHGQSLSGGERQRLCIARAMVKNAPIVILDEATAYTDPENEHLIQASVSALVAGKTLIVVAHRLSTIVDSDCIFLINEKRVAAEGTHEELMKTSDLYREMYETHMAYRDEVSD